MPGCVEDRGGDGSQAEVEPHLRLARLLLNESTPLRKSYFSRVNRATSVLPAAVNLQK